MANLHDYYFRQRVTEQELDEGFEFLEQADFNLTVDNDLIGVQQGMTVNETGVPSLNVEVADGVAYSKQGERIRVTGTQTVDVSVDENSISTEPANPGNSLVISVFVEFQRALGDSRIDGNSNVVFFNRFEDYQFIVRKGSEAVSPGGGAEVAFIQANAVAQDPNLIRVCDIIRANGQTQIFNADIFETVFREDAFVYSAGTLSVRAGTIKEADQQNLQALSDHINNIANAHNADSVAFDAANLPIPAGWTDVAAATEVQAALDGIVNDLAQSDGQQRIGFNPAGIAWQDGVDVGAQTELQGWLTNLVAALADDAGASSGSTRIGYDGAALGGPILSAIGSMAIGDALDALDNGKANLNLTNLFTAQNTFDNGIANPMIRRTENLTLSDASLIFEVQAEDGGAQKFRCYILNTGTTPGDGIYFTKNASYNNGTGQWSFDDGAQDAYAWMFGVSRAFEIVRRDSTAPSPWNNNAWHDAASGGGRFLMTLPGLGGSHSLNPNGGLEIGDASNLQAFCGGSARLDGSEIAAIEGSSSYAQGAHQATPSSTTTVNIRNINGNAVYTVLFNNSYGAFVTTLSDGVPAGRYTSSFGVRVDSDA